MPMCVTKVKSKIYNSPRQMHSDSRQPGAVGKMYKLGAVRFPSTGAKVMTNGTDWAAVIAAAGICVGITVGCTPPGVTSKPETTRMPPSDHPFDEKTPPKQTEFATGGNGQQSCRNQIRRRPLAQVSQTTPATSARASAVRKE